MVDNFFDQTAWSLMGKVQLDLCHRLFPQVTSISASLRIRPRLGTRHWLFSDPQTSHWGS